MSQEHKETLDAQGKKLDHGDNLVTADAAEKLDVVNSISALANGMVTWHVNACNQMVHAMEMPEVHPTEGTHIAIKIAVEPTEKHPEGWRYLHPKEVEAFKAGIRYAYDLVAELPFKFLPTDADGNIHPDFKNQVVEEDEETKAP